MKVTIDKDGYLVITACTALEYYAMHKWADDNTDKDGPKMIFRPKADGLEE